MKSFAPEIKVRNPFGKGGAAWLRSPARFATVEEALDEAQDVAMSWGAALNARAAETTDHVNPDPPEAGVYRKPETEE